jgi:NAD(P)-dependent dehydrogenase (short-subunit alcohol dehydrogenase family)
MTTEGRIDVLLVNDGISRFNPIWMVDEVFFDALFGINVRGAYFVMKHAIEIMQDGGSIILTSSVSGALGVVGQTVYGATKVVLLLPITNSILSVVRLMYKIFYTFHKVTL